MDSISETLRKKRHRQTNKGETNMRLSEERMIEIIKKKQINQCSEQERKQVMNFAFGEDYIKSNDKGNKKVIKEKV
jgi:hypothetical protein